MERCQAINIRGALAIAALAGMFTGGNAFAQGFPEKPIRVIVPYPPGGTTDFVARVVQNRLSATLGQAVVIENRGGATGAIGAEAVARSAADGYTLCFTPGTDMVLRHFLMKNNPVDTVKDFTPIITAVLSSSIVVANPSTPVASAKELIDFARKNPGKLTYGTPGVGSNFHLAGELLKLHNVNLTHVPYKGGGPALQAVLAGETMVSLMDFTTMLPHVREGRLKPIALIDSKRHSALPEVPAMGELLPGYFMPESWFAYFGPAKMPPALVTRINGDIARALTASDVKPKLEERSLTIVAGPPDDLARRTQAGFEIYGKVIKAAGIQPE